MKKAAIETSFGRNYSGDVNWNVFQLCALAAGAAMLVIRIAVLRVRTGVNPVKISHPSEAGFVLGEVALVVLLLRTTKVLAVPLPEWLDKSVLDSGYARFVGAVLICAGLLIFGIALISFGDSWRIGIDRKTPSALITRGIFATTRNPIFLFLDLYLAGTFLINGTRIFLIAAVLGALFLHFQILREERFLIEHYGDLYRKYCARTPRYFIR